MISARSSHAPMDVGAAPPRALSMWSALLLAGGLTAAAAWLGARASVEAATFYGLLDRPGWAPPPGVFAPVWTVLYVAMAVAGFIAFRAAVGRTLLVAVGLFAAQLAANALWSWLFFAWHRGPAAIVDVAVLLVLVAWTLRRFWRIKPSAGLLFVPYLLWVVFATALTIAMVAHNPSVL